MAAELDLRSNVFGQHGNFPGVGARATTGIANVFLERFALADHRARTGDTRDLRRAAGSKISRWNGIAPSRDDELAVVTIGNAVPSEILPEEATGGLACIREFVLRGDAAEELAFGIVGMLAPAIGDGPGFLDIVGDGSGSGPDVAVAGDVTAIVEIVENAELPGQGMLIGSDVFAVDGERRIAVGFGEIAEDLIVGAV